MSLSELLSKIHALPRPEKWRLVQIVVADLAREDCAFPIEADQTYPIWSPHDAFDAAETMLRALKEESAE